MYDSGYLATTHAPGGRALHLRSPASTWTRANFAAAFELRPSAVLDTFTVRSNGDLVSTRIVSIEHGHPSRESADPEMIGEARPPSGLS
jgi:hypothetical protein